MNLNRAVADGLRHLRGDHLDRGDQVFGHLVAVPVHRIGGLESQQPGHFDLAEAFGDILPDRGLIGELLAKGGAAVCAPRHDFQRALGLTDRAHAVMNPPRPEPPLRDFKPAAFAQDQVFAWHADIVEPQFHFAAGRVVRSEHGQVADDGDPRRVRFDQDLRMLGMARTIEAGLAHHDPHRAARMHGVGDPPLAPVEHVVVAIRHNRQFQLRRVRRGDLRFGHHIGGADRAREQRLQPALLLLRRAELGQHLHVAGIRRGAVEHLARPRHAAQQFGNRRVFQIGQAGREFAVFVRQEQVP